VGPNQTLASGTEEQNESAGIGFGTIGGSDAVALKLATRLADTARERAVDKTRDSPFALVAKENDVMWSGGTPDDVTVVVLRVVGAPTGV